MVWLNFHAANFRKKVAVNAILKELICLWPEVKLNS
ncbi:hypothetical protein [Salinimicrobium catena]|nr:hypothetical protein [Salinimicrobium catena]